MDNWYSSVCVCVCVCELGPKLVSSEVPCDIIHLRSLLWGGVIYLLVCVVVCATQKFRAPVQVSFLGEVPLLRPSWQEGVGPRELHGLWGFPCLERVCLFLLNCVSRKIDVILWVLCTSDMNVFVTWKGFFSFCVYTLLTLPTTLRENEPLVGPK
jgi:hypothetical protein